MKNNNPYQCLSLTQLPVYAGGKIFPSFIKMFICALAVRGGRRSTAATCLTLIHHDLSQPGTLNIKEEREWTGDKQSSRHREKGPNQPSTYFPSLNWIDCIVIVDVNTSTEKKRGQGLELFNTNTTTHGPTSHMVQRDISECSAKKYIFRVNGQLSRLSVEQKVHDESFPRHHDQVILTKSQNGPTNLVVIVSAVTSWWCNHM